MTILAIDPGHVVSAAIIWNRVEIVYKGFLEHEAMRDFIRVHACMDVIAIETVSSYGMPVGKEVFETVRETGRYIQTCANLGAPLLLHTRQQIVMHHCRRMGGDSQVRAAMIERFGEPGTKREPGHTYGLKADLWQAFAVAVYASDMAHLATVLKP